MAFEYQSQEQQKNKEKQGQGVFGDMYSMTVLPLPKEMMMMMDSEKDTTFDFRFQLPNLGRAFRVSSFSSSYYITSLKESNFAFGALFIVLDHGLSWFWSFTIQEFFGTREVGEFVSGALAGAMTKAVLAPLETIRLSNCLYLEHKQNAYLSHIHLLQVLLFSSVFPLTTMCLYHPR